MNRFFIMTLAAAAAAFSLQAQTAGSLSAEFKAAYNNTKNKMVRMAEKMPEEHYSFKATPDVRTFAALVGHVADAQLGTCSSVTGERKPGTAAAMTSKADLVAALKASFLECDKAYDALTDATASEMTKGARPRTKLATLAGIITHTEEEYGYMAVYMRLKGVVPPGSEPR